METGLTKALYTTNRIVEEDSRQIKSLTITKYDPDSGVYEGSISCHELSDASAGDYSFTWRAVKRGEGFDIVPLERFGIELEGLLLEDAFGHSRAGNERIRRYISEEIESYNSGKS